MKIFVAAILAAVFYCIAVVFVLGQGTIPSFPPEPKPVLSWNSMYAPPYITNPQIAFTIDCVSPKMCYLGGASNGAGAGIFKYDGQMDSKLQDMPMPNRSAMVMQVVVGGTEEEPTGVATGVEMFVTISHGLQYLANKGTEWLASAMPIQDLFVWESQSLNKLTNRTYIALGSGITGGSLAITQDAGVAFGSEKINYGHDGYANCSYSEAIATPSANVWYMTFGAEPASKRNPPSSSSGGSSFDSAEETTRDYDEHPDEKYFDTKTEVVVGRKLMGRMLMIQNRATGKVRVHTKTARQFYQDKKTVQANADPKCNFYTGAILKSTNQGKTWEKVFTIADSMTDFIECFDEQHCTVIAYNADTTSTISTVDGVNWKITYQTPLPTKQSAQMVQQVGYASQTEVWVGGSKESQAAAAGMFWFSRNGGETFEPYPHNIPGVEVITAIDFVNGVGFALGLTEFKTSQIMRYEKQSSYGDFVQSHCPVAGCSFLCQNISFPQGMCLGAQGGSAKAFCERDATSGATEIVQYLYTTTSCVGAPTIQKQPVGQCINGTNTFFENYCTTVNSAARSATDKDILRH